MKIRKGDKVLLRVTATESIGEDENYFEARDSDGDYFTASVADVVSVEPAPLPEEPMVGALVQVGLSLFRRTYISWVKVTQPNATPYTWSELIDYSQMYGHAVLLMKAEPILGMDNEGDE